jgi:hypothetical protein
LRALSVAVRFRAGAAPTPDRERSARENDQRQEDGQKRAKAAVGR